jgi:hypothetical protein
LYTKLISYAVNEIKDNLKPSLIVPTYGLVYKTRLRKVAFTTREQTFRARAKKCLGNGRLPVGHNSSPVTKHPIFDWLEFSHCLFEACTNLASELTKSSKHKCYVIPDLNKPLIFGIDFIQKHQLWYCPKTNLLPGRASPTGAKAI